MHHLALVVAGEGAGLEGADGGNVDKICHGHAPGHFGSQAHGQERGQHARDNCLDLGAGLHLLLRPDTASNLGEGVLSLVAIGLCRLLLF